MDNFTDTNSIGIPNIAHFKTTYNKIVDTLIDSRHQARLTQDFVASWLKVTRKRIIQFESKQSIDVELLCVYCDKMSIELTLKYEVL